MIYEFPATEVKQGSLKFYSATVSVRDALKEDFYTVETLDPDTGDGMQRVLEKARAKQIANHILENIDNDDGLFIPTSIFLATEGGTKFANNILTFDSSVLPLNVVDGQHRLEGFKMAAKEDTRVLDFQLAVSICPEMPKLHQMCHFYIVNTKQKKVNEAIGQTIITRLTDEYGMTDRYPSLPKWMGNLVKKQEIGGATKIVQYLNSETDSPWHQKIAIAPQSVGKKSGKTINQGPFVNYVKKHFLNQNNMINVAFEHDPVKRNQAIKYYWIGIAEYINPEEGSNFYKTNGADMFSRLSIPFSQKQIDKDRWSPDYIKELLTHIEAKVKEEQEEYALVLHADWWKSGGPGSGLNQAGRTPIVAALTRALHKRP